MSEVLINDRSFTAKDFNALRAYVQGHFGTASVVQNNAGRQCNNSSRAESEPCHSGAWPNVSQP